MSETEWKYSLVAVTSDLPVAAAFAAPLAADPGNAGLWDNPVPLRPIGSQDTEPTRWGIAIPCKARIYVAATEFDSAGPYPNLNAAGIDNSTIAYAKTKMWVLTRECDPPKYLIDRADDLAATLGYERIPEAV
jgi:hypothetical protein